MFQSALHSFREREREREHENACVFGVENEGEIKPLKCKERCMDSSGFREPAESFPITPQILIFKFNLSGNIIKLVKN